MTMEIISVSRRVQFYFNYLNYILMNGVSIDEIIKETLFCLFPINKVTTASARSRDYSAARRTRQKDKLAPHRNIYNF